MVLNGSSDSRDSLQKEDLDAAVRKVQEKSVSVGKVCLLLVPKETLRQQANNIPDSS